MKNTVLLISLFCGFGEMFFCNSPMNSGGGGTEVNTLTITCSFKQQTPAPKVMVRLTGKENPSVIKSGETDKNGRVTFNVEKGFYYVEANYRDSLGAYDSIDVQENDSIDLTLERLIELFYQFDTSKTVISDDSSYLYIVEINKSTRLTDNGVAANRLPPGIYTIKLISGGQLVDSVLGSIELNRKDTLYSIYQITVPAIPDNFTPPYFFTEFSTIHIEKNCTVEITASGFWNIGNGLVTADGNEEEQPCECLVRRKDGDTFYGHPGRLTARIGFNSDYIPVGSHKTFTAENEGTLSLTADDNLGEGCADDPQPGGCFQDNSGSILVQVKIRCPDDNAIQ